MAPIHWDGPGHFIHKPPIILAPVFVKDIKKGRVPGWRYSNNLIHCTWHGHHTAWRLTGNTNHEGHEAVWPD
jgi:hypothetical protein